MKGNSSPKVLREKVLDPFCLILIKEIPDLVGLHLISSQTWLPPVSASATGIILPLSLYSYLPAQCLAHTRDSICLLNLLRLTLSLALIILFFLFFQISPILFYFLLFSSVSSFLSVLLSPPVPRYYRKKTKLGTGVWTKWIPPGYSFVFHLSSFFFLLLPAPFGFLFLHSESSKEKH